MSSLSTHFKILKYKSEWEELDNFRAWLLPGKNEQKAMCMLCDVELVADINLLRVHARGIKHCSRVEGNPLPFLKQKPAFYNKRWESIAEYKDWLREGRLENKAECSLCDIEMRAEKTVIRNHSKSKRHLKCLERFEALTQVAKLLDPDSLQAKYGIKDGDYRQEILINPSLIFNDEENDASNKYTLMPSVDEKTRQKPARENITELITRGYKRLRTNCNTCEATLMKDRDGTVVCVNCNELLEEEEDDSEDDHLLKQEEDSDNDEFGEVIMQINDEKYNSDDNASVIHEVRENNSSGNVVRCEVQGVDIGDEIHQLVCVLKIKLANLNSQITEVDSTPSLDEMSNVLKLLNKIKQL